MATAQELLTEARVQMDRVRYDARATKRQLQDVMGIAAEYIDQAQATLEGPPVAPEPPVAPPPDENPSPPQAVAPVRDGAVYGQTKWYQGPDSPYGCDLFLPRGTPVVAPMDCVVEEVLGGTGLGGGAELILADTQGWWSFRYRHVGAQVRVGQRVSQGEQVGVINDPSLDALGPMPAWAQPMPDGWQHLDLSVNQGTDRFTPTGGAGGNTSAWAWLTSLGYQGRVLQRTPGPPDAGH